VYVLRAPIVVEVYGLKRVLRSSATEHEPGVGLTVGDADDAILQARVKLPDPPTLYASTIKKALSVELWLFRHVCDELSGSSVHCTSV
jgi:hypothetical protein